MKKIITLFVILLAGVGIYAQTPQKMSYQCVVRNASNALVQNHAVGIRISVLQGSVSGTVVYQETFNTLTNGNGLATIEIGNGTPVSGNFSTINWSSGTYYLRTETDPTGGTSYSISGTSQLESVPYALHAKSAASYSETDPVFGAAPAKNITNGNITNWNSAYSWGNHAGLYRPVSYVPAWSEITSKPTSVSGYGITDAVTTTGDQTISGIKTFNSDLLVNNLTVGRGKNGVATNTAVGVEALYSVTTGGANTAVGYKALYSNMTGANNTAYGYQALNLNTSFGNTATGVNAGTVNTTDSDNTCIGYFSNVGSNNLTNATAVGYNAIVNASNKIVLGNASATTVGGYGNWTNYSDSRLKENITYRDDLGLEFITRLKTVEFNYKEDENKRRCDGLIAQNVQNVLNDLNLKFSGLVVDDDKDRTLNLSYGDFVIPLINAVKEQQKLIENQQKQINELKLVLGLITGKK